MGFNVLSHFKFLYNHSLYGFTPISSQPIVFSAYKHLNAFCPSFAKDLSFWVINHCWRSALSLNLQYALSLPLWNNIFQSAQLHFSCLLITKQGEIYPDLVLALSYSWSSWVLVSRQLVGRLRCSQANSQGGFHFSVVLPA